MSSDHAERVLGHVIPGVRGVYDRHEYAAEKRAALEKLDVQIARILRPDESCHSFPERSQQTLKLKARQRCHATGPNAEGPAVSKQNATRAINLSPSSMEAATVKVTG